MFFTVKQIVSVVKRIYDSYHSKNRAYPAQNNAAGRGWALLLVGLRLQMLFTNDAMYR